MGSSRVSVEDSQSSGRVEPVPDGAGSRHTERRSEDLLEELYAELHRRAEHFVRGNGDWTLQATALVHEACLKLFGKECLQGGDRAHLLALASRAMRSVLVDHVRARGRIKRQPPGERVPVDEIRSAYEERALDLPALDEALAKLASFDPLMVRVVDLHFFGGLPMDEAARAVDMPLRTIERRWKATRAWLRAEIGARGG